MRNERANETNVEANERKRETLFPTSQPLREVSKKQASKQLDTEN